MFNEEIIQAVWEKGIMVDGYDSANFRKDSVGAWMIRTEYGNINSPYGWQIDHVYPQSKGGSDDLINLRPMQWQNNLSKGDDFPVYNSAIKADENKNVERVASFTVNDTLIELISKRM